MFKVFPTVIKGDYFMTQMTTPVSSHAKKFIESTPLIFKIFIIDRILRTTLNWPLIVLIRSIFVDYEF
jgi:hypothetical protein